MQPSTRSFPSLAWSLKLPKSSFPPRISAAHIAKLLPKCTDDLYAWQRQSLPAINSFVLHDGPPYANGNLHVGHALNKILKDFACRFQLTQGRKVTYVPGWDCHGLPIELKALEARAMRHTKPESLKPEEVRLEAKKLAIRTVDIQKQDFQRWGILADWEASWTTMDADFERRQLEVFRTMVAGGLIYRKDKPVYWSPSSGTALAEAELEYRDDHISTAAYVKFTINKLPEALQNLGRRWEKLHALIWTTTPWTIPANAAIAVHSGLVYSIIQTDSHDCLLIAADRIAEVWHNRGDFTTVGSVKGSALIGTEYINPFGQETHQSRPFIHADYVLGDSGTGLVHAAPGHGMEDYKVCFEQGIAAFAPVDNSGRFTKAAFADQPEILKGKDVLDDGNHAVLQHLGRDVVDVHQYTHSYPYDWRTNKPVIVRATMQWFADVGAIKKPALAALERVQFIPPSGRSRLSKLVDARSEWCISRQRAWGIPIPALFDKDSGDAVLNSESILHILEIIRLRGIDAWWTDQESDTAWIPHNLLGPNGEARHTRGKDTLDVWFDSGTSWTHMLPNDRQAIGPLADVCSEGTDQHRGWFQSSLITYVAHQTLAANHEAPEAPFKTLITHGFVLDHDGRKMSKSRGNVISPGQVTSGALLPPKQIKKANQTKQGNTDDEYDGLGPDALRLWVACSDYTSDVVIGSKVLQDVHNTLNKLRVTFKWLLGCLSDWQPARAVGNGQLTNIDRMALLQLAATSETVKAFFEKYAYHRALTAITKYVSQEFSAGYVEMVKDRVYAGEPEGISRLAAQTVLSKVFNHLLGMLAPFTPLLVEEVWSHTSESMRGCEIHPLRRPYPILPITRNRATAKLMEDFSWLSRAHDAVKLCIEEGRAKKTMGSSLQCSIHLHLQSTKDLRFFQNYEMELKTLFIVSAVTLSHGTPKPDEVSIHREFLSSRDHIGIASLHPPPGDKCLRCWQYLAPKGNVSSALCQRCRHVLSVMSPPVTIYP